ncbi:MAG: AAA-ATPase-like protein, partial [Leuconostoc sp. DORA_2]
MLVRNILTAGLKDNVYLEKALITGILRVAKESIFSGLNNLQVHTILSYKFNDKFGFEENEVIDLLKYYDLESK